MSVTFHWGEVVLTDSNFFKLVENVHLGVNTFIQPVISRLWSHFSFIEKFEPPSLAPQYLK